MNPTLCLNIRFQNKIKKFPWRQKYSQNEFSALIANCFNIKNSDKILGLKDSHGKIIRKLNLKLSLGNRFDIASWLNRPREEPPKVLDVTFDEIIYNKSLNKSRSKIFISKKKIIVLFIKNLINF